MKLVRSLALFVLVVVGAVLLYADLDGAWTLAVVLPAAIVALAVALLHFVSKPRYLLVIAMAVAALVLPIFALLGVDWFWAQLGGDELDPLASLIVGAVVVGVAAACAMLPLWTRTAPSRPLVWAVGVAVALIILPPVLSFLVALAKGDEDALAERGTAVSRLEVIVLRTGADRIPDDPTHSQGWAVQTWEGQVVGRRVRWGTEGAPPAVPADGADRVLLLMVDGGPVDLRKADVLPDARPKKKEIARWLRLANQVTPASVRTYALLRTSDDARLDRWGDALAGKAGGRRGAARSLQELAGPRTTTDLALRLAMRSPSSDQDLALAAKHRPVLLFDSHERYPMPYNVDRVLASGKMRLCDAGQAAATLCPVVHGSADLHNGASHLSFDPGEVAKVRQDPTIYVNVTRSGNDHRNTIYLDYWWYFPHNPTSAAGGALCGAGFVIANVTCFDHQSDWEGVTVVLDEDSVSSGPSAVSYAQHDGVSRYTWHALERLWQQGDAEQFGKRVNLEGRPLVFVANGTHAAYPTSCSRRKCSVGGVPGIAATRPLKENSHDGKVAWPVDETADCAALCLAALPARSEGLGRARWNAFEGRWGAANCVFAVSFICSSSQAPESPGLQGRYEQPWCAKETIAFKSRAFVRTKHDGCAHRKATETEVVPSERLLALGDSFSSGQGAGSYDRRTTGRGNTCYRSSLAWPKRVAETLHLKALPSIACSGALVPDVLDGRRRGQAERRVSQVSRIRGDPDVITISIGGNDTGFSRVVRACVTTNCVRRYDKPSGDLLELEIAKLADALPSAYRAVRRKAPKARLVVMGYPRLFPTEAEQHRVGNCAAYRRISTEEVSYLNSRVRSLNAAIAAAADEAGADFVDVTEAFDGRELRCSGPTYMNRLRVQSKLFPASFHPNASGYARLAEIVARHIAVPQKANRQIGGRMNPD